jgi:response regulator of citrate/malate metabolism
MGTQDYVSTALALGASDYIVKPFKADNLREKVAKHFAKRKPF